jgi:hypothetical protein
MDAGALASIELVTPRFSELPRGDFTSPPSDLPSQHALVTTAGL